MSLSGRNVIRPTPWTF